MAEYIEREAAIEITMQYCPDDDGSCSKAHADLRDLLDEIESIPAADVRPVVRGKWKPIDLTYGRSYYFCSACEETVNMPTAMGIPMFRYCPNCGARMEGET